MALAQAALRQVWRGERTFVWTAGVLILSGLTLASQGAFYGDEGVDLLSGALINAGRRPYVDFFYQHQPLYSYLIAWWMSAFGQSWRAVHALSALCVAAAAALVMRFVFERLVDRPWRAWAASAAGVLFAGNVLVVQYALVGQAYGLTLLLMIAALCAAARRAVRPSDSLWAGALSAGAVNASLLVLPVWPILFGWTLRRAPRGERARHGGWFLAGSLAASLPAALVAARGLRQFFFDVVEYQLRYRWSHETRAYVVRHDLRVLAGSLDSAQAGMLLVLVLAGILLVAGRSHETTEARSELLLCAWLGGAVGAYLACSHPTFAQYFVLVMPFVAVLASIGLAGLVTRLGTGVPPPIGVVVTLMLILLPSARWEYRHTWPHSARWWPRIEAAAGDVDRVTPADGRVLADPFICFVARRVPAAGFENPFALEFSSAIAPELAKALHVDTRSHMTQRLNEGEFAAVLLAEDDPRVGALYPAVTATRSWSTATGDRTRSCGRRWPARRGGRPPRAGERAEPAGPGPSHDRLLRLSRRDTTPCG